MRVSPEELAEVSKKATEVIRDTIERVEMVKAEEIFGEGTRDPERRHLLIRCKDTGVTVRLPLPTGLEWKNGQYEIVNKASYLRSIRNPNSKFAAFLKRYGAGPYSGFEIELRINERGFWEIML